MALIGVGAIKPGLVCDRAGTSEGINLCSSRGPDTGELRVLPHVIDGLWNLSVLLPASGKLFEWYRTLTGQEGRAYGDMLAELIPGGIQPSALAAGGGGLFFPTLPLEGSSVPAAALIARPGLLGRTELGRGVLEALGFMVREGLLTLGRQGFPVTEMRLSGGQGKDRRWNQLKADMSGVELLALEQPDGELGGAAVLGTMALGGAADLAQGTERIVHVRERYVPERGAAAVYEERFLAYREVYGKMRAVFNGMV
jgi:xylulokinase